MNDFAIGDIMMERNNDVEDYLIEQINFVDSVDNGNKTSLRNCDNLKPGIV